MTPAQDIDADFNHLISVCLHSWSEREVVGYVQRLQVKVRKQLQTKDRHAVSILDADRD